jgi:ribose transport system permease protein
MSSMPTDEHAATPVQAEAQGPRPGRRFGRLDLGAITPLIFFVLLIGVFGVAAPDFFLSGENLTSILNNGAVTALLACGLTVVLIVGEFDLSIAAAASFGGAVAAVLIAQEHVPLLPTILVVVAAGVVAGLANGILVTKFEIPALIVTIGVSSLLDGFTLWVTGNTVIFTGFTDAFMTFGNWRIADLQAPVFYLAAAAAFLGVMLRYTPTGRHMYATGGNRAASRLAGIRVQRQVILAFVISGALGSLAGLVYTARQGSLTPQFGTAFLLPVFAACFLGSVTLTRRKFHILGTVLGVYLIETGTNGLLILGAPAYTQQLFAGAVLILATIGARYRAVSFRGPSRPIAEAGKTENAAFAQTASKRWVGLGDGRDG